MWFEYTYFLLYSQFIFNKLLPIGLEAYKTKTPSPIYTRQHIVPITINAKITILFYHANIGN